MGPEAASQMPPSLLDLLINPIISDKLYQYFSLSTIFRIARTSRSHRQLIFDTPKVFRHLDLSKCKGAYTPEIAPIDSGGHSWRAERIDENLTRDEFCSSPLRFVFNRLEKLRVLQDVQTLVLDGLGSITNDLLDEVITGPRYNVRLLSIRQCPNIDQAKLRRLLADICQPSRPEGTPRLQGLYFFTDPAKDSPASVKYNVSSGVMGSDGATLGLLPSDKVSTLSSNARRWYDGSGRVTNIGANQRTSWEETLQICQGIISFDAVLCYAMHQHASDHLHEAARDFLKASKPNIPTIASIALGTQGCADCGKAPQDTPIWGESPLSKFPLLSPAPWSGKLIDAIRPPPSNSLLTQRLIVSCTWCLVNRHCDSCHRWWCTDCYNPKQSRKLTDLESLSEVSPKYVPLQQDPSSSSRYESGTGHSIKIFDGFCVENCLVGEMMSGSGSMGMWA